VADADAASQYRHIKVHRHYSFALRDPDVPGEISRGDVSASSLGWMSLVSRGLSAALGVVSNWP
jgi:hypothetical protein